MPPVQRLRVYLQEILPRKWVVSISHGPCLPGTQTPLEVIASRDNHGRQCVAHRRPVCQSLHPRHAGQPDLKPQTGRRGRYIGLQKGLCSRERHRLRARCVQQPGPGSRHAHIVIHTGNDVLCLCQSAPCHAGGTIQHGTTPF
jgi:hypothetical protein